MKLSILVAEGVENGQQRRAEKDSPERDNDAEQDGHEDRRPDRDARGPLEKPGLKQKLVDDDDDGVEAEDKSETLEVFPSENDGDYGEDDGDDTSEVGDEGHETADEGPNRSERNVKDGEADPPENGDTQRFDGNGAPPVQKSCAGGSSVGAEIERHSSLDAILCFGEAEEPDEVHSLRAHHRGGGY